MSFAMSGSTENSRKAPTTVRTRYVFADIGTPWTATPEGSTDASSALIPAAAIFTSSEIFGIVG